MLTRRQLLSFSLRTLFAAVALSGGACWLVRRRWLRTQHQAFIVQEVVRLGGVVGYAHEWDDVADRGTGLPIPGSAIMRRILGDHFFLTPTLVMFDESSVSTDDLPPIEELKGIMTVDFSSCPNIGDDVIDVVAQMPNLQVVCFYGTPVSFDALQRLKCLPNLKTLHVPHTRLNRSSADRLSYDFGGDIVSWNDDTYISTSAIVATLQDGG